MNKKQTKNLLICITVVIVGIIISGCVGDEHKGTDKQPIIEYSYFPLSVGNSWSYDFKAEIGGTKVQNIMNVQISKREKIDGIEVYVMEYKLNEKTHQTEYWTKENEKIICYKRIIGRTKFKFDPPQLLYDFSSLKEGETWEWKGKVGWQEVSLKGEVIGKETITVPAGTFDTYRVRITAQYGGSNISESTDRWFAYGVGMVKEEGMAGSIFVSAELKSTNLKEIKNESNYSSYHRKANS